MSDTKSGGRVVESKVVEMRFDNKQFESGVATSISTIEKLKKSLSFDNAEQSFRGIEKAAAKVDISPLGRAAETVSVKFSALEVAAIAAITNITNSAVDAGKKLVESLTVEQVEEGFTKYEQKVSAVQTIMNATGKTIDEVSASLEKLNWFTDETSYNFTDMVSNIGKFTSAGIDLDVSVTAMEGIANWAALSGQGINEASRAMYNLSQSIGVGYMKLIDWKSIENANMATKEFKETVIDTALACGTLVKGSDGVIKTLVGNEVSFTNFSDALKDGWFNSDVLLKTLSKYGEYSDEVYKVATEEGLLCAEAMEKVGGETMTLGERAFRAAQEAKTLTDAINATKDAVSTGWMTTFELIIGNYMEAKEVWTEFAEILYDIFAAGGEVRNELVADTMASGWDHLIDKIKEAGISEEQFQNELIKTAEASGKNTAEMLKMAGSFESAVQKHMFSGEEIKKTLERIGESSEAAAEATEDVSKKFAELDDISNKVILGNFGNGAERIKRLTDLGYKYSEVQDIVNRKLAGEKFTLESLSDEQLKNKGYTDEQIAAIKELAQAAEDGDEDLEKLIKSMSKPSGRELLIDSFRNALQGLIGVMDTVKEAWGEIFPPLTAETLYTIIERIHELSKNFKMTDEKADKLKSTFKGIFSVLDVIARIVRTTVSFAFDGLKKLLGLTNVDILETAASIGDLLTGFREWVIENDAVSEGLNRFVSSFQSGIDIIRGWVDSFSQLPLVKSFLDAVSGAADKAAEQIITRFGKTIDTVKSFINKLKELKDIDLDDIKSIFTSLGDDIVNCFTSVGERDNPLKGMTEAIGNTLGSWADTVVGTFTRVKNFIGGYVDYLKEHLSVSNIAVTLLGADLMVMGMALYDIFKNFATIGDNLAAPLKSFDKILKNIAGAVELVGKAKAFDVISVSVMRMAGAVLMLAGALAVVSLIKTDRLWESFGAIAAMSALVVAMGLTTAVIAKAVGTSKGIVRASNSLISMAGAVALLAVAAKLFESSTVAGLAKAGVTVAIFTAVLATASTLMAKYAPQLSSGGIAMLAMAGAVLVLVKAVNAVDPAGLGGKTAVLAGLIGGLALLGVACKNVNIGAALLVLSLVGAVKVLTAAIGDFGDIESGRLDKALKTMGSIFAMIALVLAASSLTGGNISKAGIGMLGMTLAVNIMLGTVKMIAKTDISEMNVAVGVISKIMLVFAAVVAASKFAGKYAVNAGGMIFIMSAALSVLTGLIVILSTLDPAKLAAPTACITAIMGMFALMTGISKLAEGATKPIIALTAALAVMAGSLAGLAILADLNPEAFEKAALAMIGIMGTFALMEGISKLISTQQGMLKSMLGMMAVVLALGTMVSVMGIVLQDVDGYDLAAKAVGLSALLLAFGGAMALTKSVGNISLQSLGSLGAMMLVAGLLTGLMALMQYIDADGMLEKAASLSLMLLAFCGAFAIMAVVGSLAAAALEGILITAVVVAALIAACWAIGTYMGDGTADNITKGIENLAIWLEGLGYALGSILGGAFAGLLAGLPQMGKDLSGFMENLQPFLDYSKEIDPEAMGAVSSLATALLALTGANVLNGVAGLFAVVGGITSFGELKLFGAAMKDFDDATKGIDTESVNKAAEAGKALAEMQKEFEKQGGWLDFFAGNRKWGNISDGMAGFGEVLMHFGKEVSGAFEEVGERETAKTIADFEENIKIAVQMGGLLAGMQKEFGNVGGALGDLIGDNTWTDLSLGMGNMGEAIFEFGQKTDGIGDYMDNYQFAYNAGKLLADMQKEFGNVGGLLSNLVGDNTWTDIGNDLDEFGRTLMIFGAACHSMVENGQDTAMVEILGIMNALAGVLTSIDDIYTSTANTAWDPLILGLTGAAVQIKELGQESKGISDYKDSIDNFVTIMTSLVDIMNDMTGVTGDSVADAAAAMVNVGVCANQFWSSIQGIDKSKFATVVTQLRHLLDFVKETAGLDISGLSSFRTGLSAVAGMGIDSFTNAFDNSASKIQNAAGGMLTTFTAKLKEGKSDLSEAAVYVVEGFTEGLDSGEYNVRIASERLANAVIDSIADTLGIHSPAKETYDEGVYTGQGLSGGLWSEIANVFRAGKELGESGFDGIVTGISGAVDQAKAWAANTLGGLFEGDGLLKSLIPEGFDLSSQLDSAGFGKLSDWLTDMFDDPSDKIADLKIEIEKTTEQLEKAKNKYGESSPKVKELQKKLIDLNKELAECQRLSVIRGSFDLDGLLGNLNVSGISALDGILTEDFLKMLTPEELSDLNSALNDAVSKQVTAAKKDYDSLFEAYKDGKISQAEYDKEYTAILSKYTLAQTEVVEYAADKMTDYIGGKLDKLTDNYEDKIKDIKKEMDSFTDSHTTSYKAALTFTTNKDVYDQTVGEYEKKIYALNEKLEKEEKLHGKDTYAAQNYRKEIEKLTEKMDEYKKSYEHKVKLEGLDEDEIVDVKFTDKIKKNKQLMTDLLAQIRELKKKGVSAALLQELGQMDPKEALAAAKQLNSMDNKALQAVDSNKKKELAAVKELAQEFYGDKILAETETYVANVNEVLRTLPPSAQAIGYQMALQCVAGLNDGTNEVLADVGIVGDELLKAITAGTANSTGDTAGLYTFGATMAGDVLAGVLTGFANNVGDTAKGSIDTLASALEKAAGSEEMKQTYTSIGNTIGGGINVSPVIRPVVDMSEVEKAAEEMDGLFGSFGAFTGSYVTGTSGSVNRSRQSSMRESVNESQPNSGRNFTFNQYNSSPKPMNAREIRQQTTQGLQLMTAAYMR